MRTQRLLFLGAGLIAACSSASHPIGPTTGVVSGVVTSSLGGGLTGLSVTVSPTSGTPLPAVMTGAGGAFSVPNVPRGSGSVRVSGQPALCAAPSSSTYAFGGADSAVANVRITCTQPIGALAGVVVANYGSNVQRLTAAGATVTVTPTGGVARPQVSTDANGNFQVDSIPLPVVNGVAQPGSGTIVISGNLPGGCTPPVSLPYSGLADTNTASSPLMVVTRAPCLGGTLTIDVTWPLTGGPPGFLYGPGPDDISFIISTITLSPALPGTYYVTAPSFAVASDSIVWSGAVLHLSGSPVTLTPGGSATINVTYTQRPGTGQIWIASSRGATGYTPGALIQSGVASGNTITTSAGAGAVTTDTGGNLWTTGSFGVAEYAVATLPLRSGSYTAPSNPSYMFVLPHGSTGAAGLTFDAAGHLWVADVASAAIYEYNVGSSTPIATISGPPLRAPIRIAFGPGGDLWVADTLARSLFYYRTPASTPQVLNLTSVLPGGGPYAVAVDAVSDLYVGGATNEGPAGQDSGLVAWYPGVAPQYITTPYNIWRFPGQSFAPGTRPARPPVLDLALDYTNDVWAIANNGVVNFVHDSIGRGNANPPVMVASASDLGGLAFDLSPSLPYNDFTTVGGPARVRPRPTTSRRGVLSRAGARP